MALAPRLDLRQSQSLVMTPQLQQAIKLLAYSNVELAEFVEGELERNPLLERDEGVDDGLTEDRNDVRDADIERLVDAHTDEGDQSLDMELDNTWTNNGETDSDTGNSSPSPERAEAGEMDQNLGSWETSGGGSGFAEGVNVIEQTLSEDITLHDHLMEQLSMDLPGPVDRLIGLHLLDHLDESGYMTGDTGEIAQVLNCSHERVVGVLEKMQRFDPPGIMARNLAQCLAIQLQEKDRFDPAMEALVENLDLLAKRDFPALLKICGVDAEDLTEMIGEIKALTPRPARAFDTAVAQPVVPDVLMRPRPGGGWVVELNADTLPRVLVNSRYHTEIAGSAHSKEDKTYISECLQSANWLVKSLHQRATTILKVATEIVRRQEAFFVKGVEHLRPLVLRDIATEIEMHESTVSRVTSNKYMATPRGIYELKFFFTQAIAASDGSEAHSAEAVRHRIKTMIDNENPKKILSDDKLVALLRADGVDIARRTVAKYREAMHISSSVQRRREKNAGY